MSEAEYEAAIYSHNEKYGWVEKDNGDSTRPHLSDKDEGTARVVVCKECIWKGELSQTSVHAKPPYTKDDRITAFKDAKSIGSYMSKHMVGGC